MAWKHRELQNSTTSFYALYVSTERRFIVSTWAVPSKLLDSLGHLVFWGFFWLPGSLGALLTSLGCLLVFGSLPLFWPALDLSWVYTVLLMALLLLCRFYAAFYFC